MAFNPIWVIEMNTTHPFLIPHAEYIYFLMGNILLNIP